MTAGTFLAQMSERRVARVLAALAGYDAQVRDRG